MPINLKNLFSSKKSDLYLRVERRINAATLENSRHLNNGTIAVLNEIRLTRAREGLILIEYVPYSRNESTLLPLTCYEVSRLADLYDARKFEIEAALLANKLRDL